MILDIVKSFHGEQMQVPPMHSALKVNGTKLYKIGAKARFPTSYLLSQSPTITIKNSNNFYF